MSGLWKSGSQQGNLDLPAAKRISTPAGQRLTVILENGDNAVPKPKDAHRSSMKKGGFLGLGDTPRESLEDRSHGDSSGYSYSVWSETSGEKLSGDKLTALRNNPRLTKRGGWKRVALIAAIIIAIILAIVLGVVLGTRKKGSSSEKEDSKSADSTAAPTAAPNAITPGATALPTATTSISPTSTPSSFPVGSYSMVTFLDTVQTNCTANPDTWTCYPYTTFNDDPNKSLATFNWIITSPKPNTFAISSTTNPFSISFSNTPLELLDEGLPTERYHFDLETNKPVSPSSAITSDNDAVTCFYNSTTLQAYLYTKMASSFPDASKGEDSGNPSFPVWPFAVRVEQVIGGGQDVPNCWTLKNGVPDQQITDGLQAQDAGELCSCLYKNWRTPGVY